MSDDFVLDVWKGDWGLPSVDVECLKVLTYAKISNIPVIVRATNNPFKSPKGQLPVLRYKNEAFSSSNQIFEVFQQHKYTPDSDLTRVQNSEITAFNTMLEECVQPALQHLWWIDQQNLNQLIRPWYCKVLPFPFNFFYPGKYERQAKFMMDALHPTKEDKAVETSVYSKAQKCITTLETRLGGTDYFFGSGPTTFDVLVFSHLAPLLNIPLPSCALQNHLKACSNLVKFINRILKKYFKDDYQMYEDSKKITDQEKKVSSDDRDFPNKRRNQILAGVFALTAMMGYAFSQGIVQVRNRNDEDFIEDYYLDDEEY
ncbi:hypothetical protein QAD02_003851 [Eretmocerus hayati]|uniref:Uncharacterized protein n=1 Tax=Eretmocerus hayati TaxID=131215 RepID=A0ACC2NNB3_9HYME|nr:hypothetical protein QAD02_003851 [Eretmocerus hayati]